MIINSLHNSTVQSKMSKISLILTDNRSDNRSDNGDGDSEAKAHVGS